MKAAFVLLAVVAVAAAVRIPTNVAVDAEVKAQFDGFVAKFGKVYASTEEYNTRLNYFRQNMLRLEHQQRRMAEQGQTSWTAGVTQFFDMSQQEKSAYFGGRKYPADALSKSCLAHGVTAPAPTATAVPTSFDWRTKSPPVVSPVKDQGQCGSCWAFSTVSVIESAWAIAGNNLTQFSEQEVVDCSKGCSEEPPYGKVCNQGCSGGWPWNAYDDIKTWGGLDTEKKYPYTAQDGTCERTKDGPPFAPLKNYTCLSTTNGAVASEDAMAAYLVANGPLSIAMDAGLLETYTSGILNPGASDCSKVQLDHAIVIVGYDDTGKIPYWIVRNSWAASWGEKGYFRIIKGKNACGLAAAVSAPILA